MGDIDDLEHHRSFETRRLNLEINRIALQAEENEFKIFQKEEEIKRLKESIDLSYQTIANKKAELSEL